MEWRGDDDSQPTGYIPPAPRTPSARARALIYKYQGAQLVFLILGIVFTAVGVPLVAGLNWGVPSDLAISLAGKPETGQVIDMHLNRHVTVNGRHPTVIRFRHGDLTDESSTRDWDILGHAIVGADIPIEVYGSWARVRGTERSMMGVWGLVFLVFPGMGLLFLAAAVRSNRREIRAFTEGKSTVAHVTSAAEDYTVTINGRHPFKIKYEFEIAGTKYTGSISAIDHGLIGDLMTKKQIAVLYDPMYPHINTVWVN